MHKPEVIEWAEVVLFLSETGHLNRDKITSLAGRFSKVTAAGPGKRPEALPGGVKWYSYRADDCRSDIWNQLHAEAKKDWIFFLEDDEEIDYSTLPGQEQVSKACWVPVCILYEEENKPRQYYQMRLVPAGKQPLFEGRNLPDCTSHIRTNDINLAGRPVIVNRSSHPVEHVKTEEELSVRGFSPKVYLVQGERYFQSGKYIHAAAQYRKLLNEERLLPFDRLAAVNGLTSCMAEQYKWDKTVVLAQQSIDAEPMQWLPYLIQFRIFQLNKQWDEALQVLNTYYRLSSRCSGASFDKAITEEETLLNLIELAIRAGKREQASAYLEELFNLKQGDVEHGFLHKVLILSIELADYERSVFFFMRMFENCIPDKLDEVQLNELNHFLSMFMKKGWYEFTLEIYSRLYEYQPQNELFKRRLIVALTKTQRMDKARALIAGSM